MQPKSRKTFGRFLTGLTWILIVLHVVPIAWMVYCGLKDNQEILSGKVLPGRRQNEIVFLRETGRGYLAGTADGGLTLFEKKGLRKIRHLELGTFATSFFLDGERDQPGPSKGGSTLWVLSSNRGLQEVDAEGLTLLKAHGVEEIAAAYGSAWSTLWVNEVAGSSLARSGDALYLSYRIKGYPGVTSFSPASGRFSPMAGFASKKSGEIRMVIPARGDTGPDPELVLLTTQGISLQAPRSGLPGKAVPAGTLPALPERLCALDGRRMLLSADSRAFIFDIEADTVLAWLDREPGSGNITAFARAPGRIWLGDSRGATSLPDPAGMPMKAVKPSVDGIAGRADSLPVNAARTFTPGFPSLAGAGADITSLRITAILPLLDGGALLGGPKGALSLLDAAGKPVASALAPKPSIYIHWRNYVDLWRNIDFGLYLKNSFIVCIGVMLVAMVLASMGGYALARYNFPGKNLFGYSVLATQMVPGIMLLLPLYLMFINFSRATGLVVKGSYGGLILTYAAYFVPFSIWILRGFFASLPKELEEAALVDGCGPIQAFFRIIIPSALPGIIATGVYVFLSAWDELMFAWVLTDEKTYTIPVGIRLFVGNFQNRYDLMMAAATVSTIPVMILFFLMQKHIVSGLTAGAVKE
ncbi:MAG: binding-protein-dependent transport system inner rane component [Fibrobacteres bacterium]|nr:binding-protein-dependent transport system inner rane component [Fibrobacterota bacterium]